MSDFTFPPPLPPLFFENQMGATVQSIYILAFLLTKNDFFQKIIILLLKSQNNSVSKILTELLPQDGTVRTSKLWKRKTILK